MERPTEAVIQLPWTGNWTQKVGSLVLVRETPLRLYEGRENYLTS